jgi:TetR/AcrR family transcriptional regulator, transcriptional repressor for nem operon
MAKAAETRLGILQKAFEVIYTKSYQTTSIDEIIATTKVTKGAFYYHFKTKDEMGLAIIKEIVQPIMTTSFITPLVIAENPIKEIYKMMKQLLFDVPFLKLEYGCPAGNFAQEMTPWNAEFGNALTEMINDLQKAIEHCLQAGKKNGMIRKSVNVQQVANFVMAGYWGIRNIGKVHNNTECYTIYLAELKRYLEYLK